jgi:type III pantothenate kinase
MIMCLDVGNSQIYGGVFRENESLLNFRRNSKDGSSSDEYGLYFRSVLRENDVDPADVTQVAICNVVPETLHSLKNCFRKYFNINPFIIKAGVKTGLKIKYRNPVEVGADRIANSIAAHHLFPDRNLLVIDFGTATTFCAINKDKEYLGGAIHSGLRLNMQSLEANTSKLPAVEIVKPQTILGRSTVEGIQAGLYYGAVGMIREISNQVTEEAFSGEKPFVIGTGGFASLFFDTGLFDQEVPDLVLQGLHLALKMNT